MLKQLDQLGFDGLEVHILLRRLSLVLSHGHLSSFEFMVQMFVNGTRRESITDSYKL